MERVFSNPIIPLTEKSNTSDPFVVRYKDAYYHCYANHDGVYIAKSSTLWDIGSGEALMVYDYKQEGALKNWFAPELHYINGTWYIYGAPDCGNGIHVMCVLKCNGEDPMGTYCCEGQMRGLENIWSIDGTAFFYKENWWFSWTDCSQIFLTKLEDPLTIGKERVVLTRPEYDFEKHGSPVNEGSAVIIRNDKLFIVYSASDSRDDGYCLGLLEFLGNSSEEMLQANKWKKTPHSIFEQTDGIYGPGHCSFTKVEKDGVDEDYIVYHANLQSGSGWNGRSVWTQKFTFDENDKPVFGVPKKHCVI